MSIDAIGAPVNMDSIDAMTGRYIERFIGFGYYPWREHHPVPRSKEQTRNAILIPTGAPPAFVNTRIFGAGAMDSLEQFASLIDNRVGGTVKVRLVNERYIALTGSAARKARRIGRHFTARSETAQQASCILAPVRIGRRHGWPRERCHEHSEIARQSASPAQSPVIYWRRSAWPIRTQLRSTPR